MHIHQKMIVFTAALISSVAPSFAVSDTAEGQKLYSQGKLGEAAACLESVISRTPHDASAHYLLGNIHATRGNVDLAEKEYLQAMSLNPNGSAGIYSHQAIQRLEQARARTNAPGSGAAAGSVGGANVTREQEATGDSLLTRKSASDISTETNRRETELERERDSRVKTIMRERDDRVKQLEDERAEKIAANGSPTYQLLRNGRRVMVYDPGPANDVVRQEYVVKFEEVKEQIDKRVEEVMKAYHEKTGALEDSAISLHKEYLQPGKSAKLSPGRTNMYTRNYETADEPSGGPVPVQAAPAKSLKTPPLNDKANNKK